MKPRAAIVDAYSSGKFFAPELKLRGFECVHVQSTPEVPPIYRGSFRPDDFVEHHVGTIPERLDLVLPGCETGVELADRIAERLGFPGNGTKLSAARRNKFLMSEAVRERGVRAVAQFRSGRLDELLAWARAYGRWPVVVKPLSSAGTDSVARCHSEAEIESAFRAIHGTTNQLGLANDEVLIQEFLEGTEYFVDTASHAGRHYAASIWRYNKIAVNGASFVYDTVELLPATGALSETLAAYTFSVLDALDIAYGAAHTEVMMTPTGPCLVEIGARLSGANQPFFQKVCQERSQLDLTLDAFLAPEAFLATSRKPYEVKKWGLEVDLIAPGAGRLQSTAPIEALRSFLRIDVKAGGIVDKTVDMATCPAIIQLAHEDQDILWSDYRFIRSLEASGLYAASTL